jgi:hypothetical protein
MRIIDTLGTLIVPGTVPTGNLLWVGAVDGNNSLAVRGRMTVPFKTLGAAKLAAQAGDTIVVMPGSYAESDLAKHQVNWHFMNGAIVSATTPEISVFKVTSQMTFQVSGEGRFELGEHVLEVNHSAANITFQGLDLVGAGSGVRVLSAQRVVVLADRITGDEASAVHVSGGTAMVRVREIYSDQVHGVQVSGGTLDVEAYRITAAADSGIYFAGGTANITAFEVFAGYDPAVEYNDAYDGLLTLRNARLVSNSTRAVFIAAGATGAPALRLWNCLLKAPSGSLSIEPNTGNTAKVGVFGDCTANRAYSGSITLYGAALTTNSNLS